MADAQAPVQQTPTSRPIPIAKPANAIKIPTPSAVPLPPPVSATLIRNSHLNLDTFSPVNQNGSFEFDRVLKSGYVQKRTRKTKAWKQIYLVLRPSCLSIYKDSNEDKLRHKITLTDLTAVAFLKDPKNKRQNVFGLFSPSRNYHLEAASVKDAEEWVELIRSEARIEEEEELLASPGGTSVPSKSMFEHAAHHHREQKRFQDERLGSSSPEPLETFPPIRPMRTNADRRASHTIDYSGNELASHSDMSEGDTTKAKRTSKLPANAEPLAVQAPSTERPVMQNRNMSQMSGLNVEDPERVVWHGYLLMLKSKGGVKQWKDLWVVIRQKNLSIYKNDSEYAPLLIVPLSSIINVVEIDPLSKTKRHCLQVITEEKSYKFCAHSEDTLDKSLGAFKSLLAKRKDHESKGAR